MIRTFSVSICTLLLLSSVGSAGTTPDDLIKQFDQLEQTQNQVREGFENIATTDEDRQRNQVLSAKLREFQEQQRQLQELLGQFEYLQHQPGFEAAMSTQGENLERMREIERKSAESWNEFQASQPTH